MKTSRTSVLLSLIFSFALSGCGILRSVGILRPTLTEKISEFRSDISARKFTFEIPPRTRIDTVKIDPATKVVEISFNEAFSLIPYRNENVKEVYRQVRSYFADYLEGYTFSIQALRRPLEQLIPNYFRKDTAEYDKSRLPLAQTDCRTVPSVSGTVMAGTTIVKSTDGNGSAPAFS
jgi:hypothetical protein